MKIEVQIPDFPTLLAFAKTTPPDGVTIREVTQELNSTEGLGVTKIIIEFAVGVSSIVIGGIILSAFDKYLKKKPEHKTRINHREVRLERTEVIRVIEEIRTTQNEEDEDGAE